MQNAPLEPVLELLTLSSARPSAIPCLKRRTKKILKSIGQKKEKNIRQTLEQP